MISVNDKTKFVCSFVWNEKDYWKGICRLHGYSNVNKMFLNLDLSYSCQSHYGTSEVGLSSNYLGVSLLCNSDRAANSSRSCKRLKLRQFWQTEEIKAKCWAVGEYNRPVFFTMLCEMLAKQELLFCELWGNWTKRVPASFSQQIPILWPNDDRQNIWAFLSGGKHNFTLPLSENFYRYRTGSKVSRSVESYASWNLSFKKKRILE